MPGNRQAQASAETPATPPSVAEGKAEKTQTKGKAHGKNGV